jgi:succinoglycan biosynthesis protein ExoA
MVNSVWPFITVVVPVLNEEAHIINTLTELLAQEYPQDRFEVIVADGGSTDQTTNLVLSLQPRYPQIRLIHNPGRRSSAGRNIGFQSGVGEYFIVVDAHCRIDNSKLFMRMVETFKETGALALGRPQALLRGDHTTIAEAIVLARSSILGHSIRSFIYSHGEGSATAIKASIVSTGAMYHRAVFEKVGYVDESFDACEDVEFNYRVEAAGLDTYFAPALGIYYYARTSLGPLWRQMVQYGIGRGRFLRKHLEAFSLETLIPAAFALIVILAPIVGVLNGTLMWLLLIVLTAYAAVVLLVSSQLGMQRRSIRIIPLLIASHFIIHMGLGCGFLCAMGEPWIQKKRYVV